MTKVRFKNNERTVDSAVNNGINANFPTDAVLRIANCVRSQPNDQNDQGMLPNPNPGSGNIKMTNAEGEVTPFGSFNGSRKLFNPNNALARVSSVDHPVAFLYQNESTNMMQKCFFWKKRDRGNLCMSFHDKRQMSFDANRQGLY